MIKLDNEEEQARLFQAMMALDGVKELLDLFSDSLSGYTDMNEVGNKLHEKTTYAVELARYCMDSALKTANEILY